VLAVVEKALLLVRMEKGADTLLYSDQVSSKDSIHHHSMPPLQKQK